MILEEKVDKNSVIVVDVKNVNWYLPTNNKYQHRSLLKDHLSLV